MALDGVAKLMLILCLITFAVFMLSTYYKNCTVTLFELQQKSKIFVHTTINTVTNAESKNWKLYLASKVDNNLTYLALSNIFRLQASERKSYIDTMYSRKNPKFKTRNAVGFLYNILAPEVSF